MAEARDMNVDVTVRFNTHYPKVPSTIEERTVALKEAKSLLTSTTNGGVMAAIAGTGQHGVPPTGDGTLALLRLAEYITVGHDYFDTHPVKDLAKLSKKERRARVKEIRRIVVEEVEEELDKRQREFGAGKLIIPEMMVGHEDGTETPLADFIRQQQTEQEADRNAAESRADLNDDEEGRGDE